MDSSNIGETTISKNLKDEREDKGHSENRKIAEPCTKNESVISPAKRKSELTVKDETKRRRSTECTQRDSCHDSLASLTKVKNAISITGRSEKSQELLPSTVEIHDTKSNAETYSLVNKVEELTTKATVIETTDESDSVKHDVQAKSKNLRFSETFQQSKGNLNQTYTSSHSDTLGNLTVKKTRIDYKLSTDERDIDEKEFKFQEALEVCQPYEKQQKMPVAQKAKISKTIADEKLNADCEKKECINESLGDSSLQDVVLTDVNPVKSEPYMLRSAKFSDILKEFVEKQYRIVFKADESPNKEANSQIASKLDSKVHTIQKESENVCLSNEFNRCKNDLSSNKLFLENINTSSICDHAYSLGNLKTEEIVKQYTTEDQSMCKSKIIESGSVDIDNSNEKQSRIIEVTQTENLETGVKGGSKLQVIDETCQKHHSKLLQDAQTISPVKRKSERTAEDEIKRRRNIHRLERECDKKSLINSSDGQDTVSSVEHYKTCSEISSNIVAFSESIKEETAGNPDGMIKPVDESTIKETSKQSENKTDSKIPATQTSGKFAPFEGLAARLMLTEKIMVSLNKSLHSSDTFSHSESGLFKERSSEYAGVSSNNYSPDSLNRITTVEMIDHQKNAFSTDENKIDSNRSDTETENSKKHDLSDKPENKFLKSPRTMINRGQRVSRNTSLEASQSSDKSEDPNISKSCQENPHSDLPKTESVSSRDPRASSRATRTRRVHPIYLEPESKFVPVEEYKNDPEIVESQKQILASIEQHSATNQQINPEPNSGPVNKFLHKKQHHERVGVLHGRGVLDLFLKKIALQCAPYVFQTYPDAVDNLTDLHRITNDIAGKFMIFLRHTLLTTARLADEEMHENRTSSPSKFRENEEFPYAMPADDENKSPKSWPNIYENESPKSRLPDNENLGFPDLLPSDRCPVSPISSPKKETDKSLEMDYPIFKEYPGLAEEPAKVKKDARYQKKFYKKKPVKLPINWNMATSSTEPDLNINSEDNEIQNDAQNLLEDKDEKVLYRDEERKYQEDDQSHKRKDGESHSSAASETLQYADGYKISSFMEESPTSPTGSSKSDSSEKK